MTDEDNPDLVSQTYKEVVTEKKSEDELLKVGLTGLRYKTSSESQPGWERYTVGSFPSRRFVRRLWEYCRKILHSPTETNKHVSLGLPGFTWPAGGGILKKWPFKHSTCEREKLSLPTCLV